MPNQGGKINKHCENASTARHNRFHNSNKPPAYSSARRDGSCPRPISLCCSTVESSRANEKKSAGANMRGEEHLNNALQNDLIAISQCFLLRLSGFCFIQRGTDCRNVLLQLTVNSSRKAAAATGSEATLKCCVVMMALIRSIRRKFSRSIAVNLAC